MTFHLSLVHHLSKSSLCRFLRAYLLGYLSSVAPKLFSLLAVLVRRRRSLRESLYSTYQTLRVAAQPNRFPAFCGVLVGSSTFLSLAFNNLTVLVERHLNLRSSAVWRTRLARFFAALVASSLSFVLLNSGRDGVGSDVEPKSKKGEKYSDDRYAADAAARRGDSIPTEYSCEPDHENASLGPLAVPLAGRTLDLTLFATIRALDASVHYWWAKHKEHRTRTGRLSRLERTLSRNIDPAVFALSSGIIMWSFVYKPDRLPRSYNAWMSTVARIDPRLLETLRQIRFGNFVYGKDTGMAPLLQGMCREYGMPEVWGDPAKTAPVPCELYHMGLGPSCEWHAMRRFVRGWWFAMKMYLPLNLLLLLKRRHLHSSEKVYNVLIDACRSSAFLGTFITFFSFSVCLARTRIGPRLFSEKTISKQMWDGGLCIGAGCLTCGWSILLEKAGRRQELASFVAPRAAATVFGRRYQKKVRNAPANLQSNFQN